MACLIKEAVNFSGQLDIQRRETAFAVGAKFQADFIVTDIDVRVMIGFFGDFGHSVYEIDGFGEVFEFKGALDGFAAVLPFGEFFQQALELIFRN